MAAHGGQAPSSSPLSPAAPPRAENGACPPFSALGAIAELTRSGSPLAQRVRTVRDLVAARAKPEPAAWSAALPRLARLFPAGLPQGELVELVGRRSAGRFGVALELLAAATSTGENAALVDLGDALDPQEGALTGIDLARLLWARPTHLKPALLAAESLLAGGFALVVIELGLPPVAGGRGVEAHWLRLARAAREGGALALVSAPYRVAGFAAPLTLELQAARAHWLGRGREPRLLAALDGELTVAHAAGGRSALGESNLARPHAAMRGGAAAPAHSIPAHSIPAHSIPVLRRLVS